MKIWTIQNPKVFYENILKLPELKVSEAIAEKEQYYGEPISIPKKNGTRTIYSVNNNHDLYKLQKNLYNNFFSNILLADNAYGFIKQRNYVEFLLPHTDFYKNKYYLRLDINNFFDSITIDVIKDCLEYYFKEGESLSFEQKSELISTTIDIITHDQRLLQGTPTAPVISNIIFRRFDLRIQKYCQNFDVEYSRYADDLLFSCYKPRIHKQEFLKGISKIINSGGFTLNFEKIIKSKSSISLGGYVISDSISLSRKKLAEVSCILFFLENNKYKDISEYYSKLNQEIQKTGSTKTFQNKYKLSNYLSGNRAFLVSIIRYSENDKFLTKANRLLDRLGIAEKTILDS